MYLCVWIRIIYRFFIFVCCPKFSFTLVKYSFIKNFQFKMLQMFETSFCTNWVWIMKQIYVIFLLLKSLYECFEWMFWTNLKKTSNLNLRSAFLRALNCFDTRLLNIKIIRKPPSINMCNGVYETEQRKKNMFICSENKILQFRLHLKNKTICRDKQ